MEKSLEEYKKNVEKSAESQEEQQLLQKLTNRDWQYYYEKNLSPRAVITAEQMGY